MKQKVRLFRQLFPRYLVVSLLLSLVVGCAGATTQQTAGVSGKTLPRPPVLLIYDLAVAPDDAPPSAEIERHRAIAKAFSEELVIKLEGVGIPAQRGHGFDHGPPPRGRREGPVRDDRGGKPDAANVDRIRGGKHHAAD